ncbi:PLP-dependent aminotransferase family protein [Magnetovibrio sp.]|uniref:MocR-like pyridoxine biosynthesis transcription factor PdxR n=1 Tax=Magnetovibrio sp. TaxID=2024836 RepID=UPI002F9500BF
MPDHPLIGLSLDPNAPTAMFAQIYDALRQRIVCGEIGAGRRLPPSRSFAEELGVSRTTVVTAYDQLIAEGFAEGRTGSGVYVSDIGTVEIAPAPQPRSVAETPALAQPSALRPFHPGHPDMRLFPHRQWGQCLARVARTDPQALAIQTDPFGDLLLRTAIADYLAEWRAMKVSPEQILITAGASDALEICVRTLAQPGDSVALENPGYRVLRALIQSLGLQTIWLDVDEHGAQLPTATPVPLMSVLTPSSQYPLGGAMPLARRRDFLAWSEHHGGWIVEDDYDSEFRYGGRPIPALSSFDNHGRTLYIGSFSKVFSDTLRLGFLVMPRHLIPNIGATLARFGSKASLIGQRPLGVFMQDGGFYRHIRRMRRIYAERRRVLIGLFRDHFIDERVQWRDHHSGMHLVVHLPSDCDDVEIAARATDAGLSCPALSTYCAGAHPRRGLLLGFCGFDAPALQDAMPKLARIVMDALNRIP